jgi:microcompartment protein CcmK/EutM
MIRGRVLGEVWATRKVPALGGQRLLLVEVCGQDRVVVAVDTMDAREGEAVLVSVGSGARNTLAPPPNRDVLCDAAISMIVDGEG